VTGAFQPRDTDRARELRNCATPAERRLWTALSGSKIGGHKFSRQMPIGPFFADFLCRAQKLVIEIDGYSHEVRAAHDAKRDAFMTARGYRILRFGNDDVLGNLEGVVQAIGLTLNETCPPPAPPASGRGESAHVPPAPGRLTR